MTTTTYSSKVGPELLVPLVIVFGITSALLIYERAWVGLLINMTAVTGICYIIISTTYTIDGNVLYIRSALITPIVIEIDSIHKVMETRDTESSPAVSLDRLEIVYGNAERVLISPRCKKEFIAQLQTLKPEIEFVLRKNLYPQ